MLKKLIIIAFLLCANTVFASKFITVAFDPANSGRGLGGFQRLYYINSMKCIFSPFGSGPATGDNSMRCFDPLVNTWIYLYPNNFPVCAPNCLPNRDNHTMFYIPQLDEVWITGGSHIEALPPNQQIYAGRLSFTGCHNGVQGRPTENCAQWVATSQSGGAAFDAVLENSNEFNTQAAFIDPGMAWHPSLNMGMTCCGFQNEGDGRWWMIVPNVVGNNDICSAAGTGSKLYRMCEMTRWTFCTPGTCPAPQRSATNQLIEADGENFYLSGGRVTGSTDNRYLWRWNRTQHRNTGNGWTRLADPPSTGENNVLVYDQARNILLMWVLSTVYKYTIATNTWTNITPSGMPSVPVCNQQAAFAPNADLWIIQGGVDCSNGSFVGVPQMVAIYPDDNFYIPPRTWIARDLIGTPAASPITGNGFSFGGKHFRWTVNPNNGRMYLDGGDPPTNYAQDFQGLWSVDLTALGPIPGVGGSAYNPTAWTEEYPSCGRPGEILPGNPDEVGWTFDTKRNLFWHLPGFHFIGQNGFGPCANQTVWSNTNTPLVISGALSIYWGARNPINGNPAEFFESTHYSVQLNTPSTNQITLTKIGTIPDGVIIISQPTDKGRLSGEILTFNPVTKLWAQPGAPCEPLGAGTSCGGEKPKNGFYDPVNDMIWRGGTVEGSNGWTRYHIGTNSWSKFLTVCADRDAGATSFTGGQSPCPPTQERINDVTCSHEYLAFNDTDRKIYCVDFKYYRIIEVDMATITARIKKDIPFGQKKLYNASGQSVTVLDDQRAFASRTTSATLHDLTQIYWDKFSKKLLYPDWTSIYPGCGGHDSRADILLKIFDPTTNTWEISDMFQPQGLEVRGNSGGFDSVNNVMMVYGGFTGCPDDAQDGTFRYIFLYRNAPALGDVDKPNIIVTSHTSPVNTSSSTIDIFGTAIDNIGVTVVNIANNRGGSYIASGTTNWLQNGITLQQGQNILSICASDAAGNVGCTNLTVNLNATDITNPVISFVLPTSGPTFTTAIGTLNITGIASDNIAVVSVLWENDRGGSGNASGTVSWSQNNIILQSGVNNITVRAFDAAGNFGTKLLAVTYNPPPINTACIMKLGDILKLGSAEKLRMGVCS